MGKLMDLPKGAVRTSQGVSNAGIVAAQIISANQAYQLDPTEKYGGIAQALHFKGFKAEKYKSGDATFIVARKMNGEERKALDEQLRRIKAGAGRGKKQTV